MTLLTPSESLLSCNNLKSIIPIFFVIVFHENIKTLIIIHDGRNVCVKFGYDADENTFISYQKLISKDNIFKLTKKDLE